MSSISLKFFLTKEFLTFLVVGLINTIIGYFSIFILLNYIKLDYWFSTFIGNSIGASASYLLNKQITFRSKNSIKSEFHKFIMVIIFCYGLSYGVSYLIITFIKRTYSINITSNIIDNCAVIAGMIIYTITNYLGQKYIVFKK
jgi:putative flippase GtrA